MPRLVQDAQVEAMVGKVKNGLSVEWESTLQVSMALPPPTAKIISASATLGFNISIFSTEASPPYQNGPTVSIPASFAAAIILSCAAARACLPPIIAAFLPYDGQISFISSYASVPTEYPGKSVLFICVILSEK